MADDLESRIDEFLRGHDTMTVATVDAAGQPYAAAVFYAVTTDRRLVFVSDPATRHGINLARDPRVAATIQADGQDWAGIRGIQIRGSARLSEEGAEANGDGAVFLARFPFVGSAERLRGALRKTRFWSLTPAWIRLIDNRRGFGHSEEWNQGS